MSTINEWEQGIIKQYSNSFYQEKKTYGHECCGDFYGYFDIECKKCKKDFVKTVEEDFKKWNKKPKINPKIVGLVNIKNYVGNVTTFWEIQQFFYDRSGLFWFWQEDKHCYGIVDEVDLMNSLDNNMGLMGMTVSSQIKAAYLEAFKRVGRKHLPKDAPSKWVQFKDKAYSLTANTIYDVQPNYFFTNPIPWELGLTDRTPVMDKLFTEWVGEKHKTDLYEIIAYCCYREYPIQSIFCLHGSGRNGKSQFMKLLNKFLGETNICSTELDRLANSNNKFESFKMFKKLMCSMGETNFGTINNTSMLKKLCGGDLIDYEVKNKNPFNGYNYAKIIIGSNSLPSTNDTSDGFMRRWHIIDFPNEFKEGKDIIATIPENEYNNLAKKVINILPKLLNRGHLTNQGTIEERREKYISVSNPVSLFISKHCERKYESFISFNELYQAYVIYLNKNKKRKVSRKEFKSVIEDEGLLIERTSKKINEQFVNGYWIDGIELCVNYVNYVKNLSQKLYIKNQVKIPAQFTQFTQNDLEIVEEYIEDNTDIVKM
jgi:P4 family phage/plasmid primase-like protien